MIISSHILSEVQEIADTVGIVREGRLVYQEKFDKSKDLTELFMENVKEWSVK
jgi:ABC-2 type transport system ATP-binding protein